MGKVGAAVGSGGLSLGGSFLQRQGDQAAQDYNNLYNSFDPGARPEAAAFLNPVTDFQNGTLNSAYQLSGPEAYIQAALAQQSAEENALGDKASSQAAGANTNALSQLASRGGLRGGSAQRLAMMSQRNVGQALQDVNMQGMQNRAQIGLQGEGMKRDTEKYNLGTKLGAMNSQNEYNANKYNQQMQAWAANKQAQATLAAGKGKGQSGGMMGGVGRTLGK